MPTDKLKEDDPMQSKRFLKAAREAEADETNEAADRNFKKVVKPPRPRSGQEKPK